MHVKALLTGFHMLFRLPQNSKSSRCSGNTGPKSKLVQFVPLLATAAAATPPAAPRDMASRRGAAALCAVLVIIAQHARRCCSFCVPDREFSAVVMFMHACSAMLPAAEFSRVLLTMHGTCRRTMAEAGTRCAGNARMHAPAIAPAVAAWHGWS